MEENLGDSENWSFSKGPGGLQAWEHVFLVVGPLSPGSLLSDFPALSTSYWSCCLGR